MVVGGGGVGGDNCNNDGERWLPRHIQKRTRTTRNPPLKDMNIKKIYINLIPSNSVSLSGLIRSNDTYIVEPVVLHCSIGELENTETSEVSNKTASLLKESVEWR